MDAEFIWQPSIIQDSWELCSVAAILLRLLRNVQMLHSLKLQAACSFQRRVSGQFDDWRGSYSDYIHERCEGSLTSTTAAKIGSTLTGAPSAFLTYAV